MATIGLAEWSVRTPGGAVICHMDGWKERHGDCLRSPDGDTVHVERLRRWRYHQGIVSGETDDGYFLYDERTSRVRRFGSERLLREAIARLDVGRPLSGWLTAADGWAESFFFEMVWIPCQIERHGPLDEEEAEVARALAGIETPDCSEALGRERLALYDRTTWGRQCRDARVLRNVERGSPSRAMRFRQLCEALAEHRSVAP
jgi:hypothetical protein